MQDLNSEINAVIRKFGLANGNLVDSLSRLVPILSVILTLIITVGTVLTGLDDTPEGNTDEPPVVAPVTPVANEQMRTGIINQINQHRPQHGALPVELDLVLHANAQKMAVANATAGEWNTPTGGDNRVLVLQARDQSPLANANKFFAMWMERADNFDALMHQDNHSVGVGVAEANGQTYAVVQFMQR